MQLFRLSESMISAKHGQMFLKALIRDLKESMGPSFVKSKWQESGLQIKQWMDEKLVSMFFSIICSLFLVTCMYIILLKLILLSGASLVRR